MAKAADLSITTWKYIKKIDDFTILPNSDIVAIDGANSDLKRVTMTGRVVWACEIGDMQPKRVCYVQAAERLIVLCEWNLYWMSLDGTMGDRICAYIKQPADVCAGGEHELYVADSAYSDKQVHVIDWRTDKKIRGFETELDGPDYICCLENGTVVVSSYDINEMQAYTPTGEQLWKWREEDSFGPRGEVLYCVWGVCPAPGGGLFAADTWNHRVMKISDSGQRVCDVIKRKDGLKHLLLVKINKEGQFLVTQDGGPIGMKIVTPKN